jgi:ankyrin repeat protein
MDDRELFNLLRRAISFDNIESFSALANVLEFPIDKKDQEGETLLFAASEMGKEDIVRYLINRNANVNLANNKGETPYYVAMQNNHGVVANALHEAGADVNVVPEDGVVLERLEAVIDGAESALQAAEEGRVLRARGSSNRSFANGRGEVGALTLDEPRSDWRSGVEVVNSFPAIGR